MRYSLLIFLFLFVGLSQKAKASRSIYFIDSLGVVIDSCEYTNTEFSEISFENRPNPILQLVKRQRKKNKRVIAAILAFPFPFGIVGLHRIYLGTAPHVPIVYIGTFGGVLGILPFIDFCVIMLDKDLDRYLNNNKIFMWVK
ncbi:MAG: TM2 domain-containing protein [Sphingobacteriaceae bacterium]|nr:TM2 domain-containing protein [Sphingobacteriaceae bacterium]